MGGTIDVNVKGDIRIEGAGNVVYAQKNGAGAESEINIHADGDIFLSSNSGVAVSASSLNTADAGYKSTVWDEGTKNGPDRSALLGHNFVYQETKPHGFYSSYFHQRISS